MEKCNHCTKSKSPWEPWEWVKKFYQPIVEYYAEVDVKRCPDCGQVYQFSFIQCLVCFCIIFFIFILSQFLYIIPSIGRFVGIVFPILTYPLALEIPRRYLPWKKLNEPLLYSHWKSRLGLILAHVLGMILGPLAALEMYYALLVYITGLGNEELVGLLCQ